MLAGVARWQYEKLLTSAEVVRAEIDYQTDAVHDERS
jgi:hypothetical protein